MSREVRRVPLDWKHPTHPYPETHWSRTSPSRLHDAYSAFFCLNTPSVSDAQARWDEENAQWSAGTHKYQKAYPYVEYAGERPTTFTNMPDFPADEVLGFCLYETVSEGTPVTPVFATEEELVNYLSTIGQDHGDGPMRRESAEILVKNGDSFCTFMVINNTIYNCADDADKLQKFNSPLHADGVTT